MKETMHTAQSKDQQGLLPSKAAGNISSFTPLSYVVANLSISLHQDNLDMYSPKLNIDIASDIAITAFCDQ